MMIPVLLAVGKSAFGVTSQEAPLTLLWAKQSRNLGRVFQATADARGDFLMAADYDYEGLGLLNLSQGVWHAGRTASERVYRDVVAFLPDAGGGFVAGVARPGAGFAEFEPFFVRRYDKNMTVQWEHQIGNSSGGYSYQGLAADSLGYVWVTGMYCENLADFTYSCDNASHLYAMRLDAATGSSTMTVTVAPIDARNSFVRSDSVGNLYVAGTETIDLGSLATNGVFVVKLSSLGIWQWTARKGPGEAESVTTAEVALSVTAMEVDLQGNVFLLGLIERIAYPSGLRLYSRVAENFVGKWNSSGSMQWTVDVKAARALHVDAAGAAFLLGGTSESLDGHAVAGEEDIFIMKFSSAGTREWTQLFGTPGLDRPHTFHVRADGVMLVVGTSDYSWDCCYTPRSSWDWLVLKIQPSLSATETHATSTSGSTATASPLTTSSVPASHTPATSEQPDSAPKLLLLVLEAGWLCYSECVKVKVCCRAHL